jgi:5,10-methylenetetrahydrofolate reductase
LPQKRGEVAEKVGQAVPDTYEAWLKKQVEARSRTVSEERDDEEEDDIDEAEDLHEKAHRRKRGKGSAASGS